MAQATLPVPSESQPDNHGHGHGHPETTTGTTNTKLAMWIFLSSECLFFGAFIATYLLYRGRSSQGSDAEGRLQHPVHVGDVVHPADELTHHGAGPRRDPTGRPPALPGVAVGDRALRPHVHLGADLRVHRVLPRGTLALDEHVRLELLRAHRHPRRPRDRRHHLAPVPVGLSMQGQIEVQHSEKVEIAGLYWHFVDVVWIVIFTVIYLIPK